MNFPHIHIHIYVIRSTKDNNMKSDYRLKRVTTSKQATKRTKKQCWINNTFHVDASVFSTFQLMNIFSRSHSISRKNIIKRRRNKMKFAMIQCGFSNENGFCAKKSDWTFSTFLFCSTRSAETKYKKILFIYLVNICFAFSSWEIQVPQAPPRIHNNTQQTIN